MIPKSTIIVHIYILLTLYMYIKMVEIGNSKIDHSRPHIYILTLIYVCLIGQNWKSKKDKI